MASRAVDEPVPLWVGLITVSATVLASLQTFFRFGERAAFNAQAGQRYALLRRRLEDALVQPPENVDADLDDIRKEMEKLGEQSPPIGERRWLTWEDYSDKEQVPRNRHWWQILLGFPARRRRKRSADDGSTVTGAVSLQDEAPVRRT